MDMLVYNCENTCFLCAQREEKALNAAREQRIEAGLRKKAEETGKRPGRIAWLWMNMEGVRGAICDSYPWNDRLQCHAACGALFFITYSG